MPHCKAIAVHQSYGLLMVEGFALIPLKKGMGLNHIFTNSVDY